MILNNMSSWHLLVGGTYGIQVDVVEAGKVGKRARVTRVKLVVVVFLVCIGQYQKWFKEGTVVNWRQGHGDGWQRLPDKCGEQRSIQQMSHCCSNC